MFSNYIRVAFRNFLKYKGYSVIDFIGLAMGITACLLIIHYVNYEKSYEKYHSDYERIYRLRYERTDEAGEAVRFASCTPPAAARIRGKYAEVEKIGRMLNTMGSVSYKNIKYREDRIFYAEPEIFEILSANSIKGNPIEILGKPDNACISQSIALKYFGDEDPIGKIISINKKSDYLVGAVFEDVPHNTHLKYDIILPWENLAAKAGPEYTEAWGHTGTYTYLRVQPGTDPVEFEKKLLNMVETECPWLEEYKLSIDLKMQPLADIHLNSHYMQEYEVNGDKETVDLLFLIAIFIIIIAWVNYTNLSTARAFNRAKEIGLRKVVGASRRQLIVQFFCEIAMVNFISILGAIGLIELFIPYFGQLTGIPSNASILGQNWFWGVLAIVYFTGVIFSGIYPVIAMSSFRPIAVIKGKFGKSSKGINVRKVLVIFQFTVSLVL
ncbi:MAG: ABC transporter permease, partial [Candidatus Zixiibacteriota bacterium]